MSAEQKEKDLKIKRRTAKAKLTRLLNALQKLLDSNRNLDEVTESLQSLELAYKDLEEKHEAYCEIIEDDEQFLKEGTWLEECQSNFMDMQIKAKDCIKAKASEASERAETQPAVNDSSNVASPERPDESNSPQVESAFRVQVERPKLPHFSGDVRVYSTFKSDFHHLIDRYSKRDAMAILRTALHGKPLELIRGIGNDYDEAWALLDSIYGDPRLVADVIVDEMERFPPLKEGDDARFCDLVHIVMRSYNTLKEVGRTGDMDNSHMLALVERKMTSNDRKVWFRYLQRDRQEATFEALRTWMSGEMKMRLRASAPLRDARSSTQQKDKRSSASVSHIAEEDKSGKQADHKCWICKSSDHWVDQCKKLLSKSQPERFQMMKDNHACYSCLKRAGRDHNMKTCKRRKRCTEKLNGEQCTSFHHPLLHKEIAREIVASVSGKTALLPVVTVTMMGSKDQSYSANCLLDSGAQISLVRRSVAENLGLKGKPISINITKVGCVTEEVQTKIYRLRLRSLDDNRVYRVSAVGLDSINDDIVQVQTDDLCKTFNLGQNCLHRSSGSIDVLVGIDHAKLHTGETRQKGNLVARHTPLGWVVFGADPDHQAAKSTVLNVMVTDAVDLKDFWTTESMGVCHSPSQYQPDGLSRQEMDEKVNVADDLSRGLDADQLTARWQHGPDFLREPMSDWPEEGKAEEKMPEMEKEMRKDQSVLNITQPPDEDVIDCAKFSSWRKLIRVTSYVLRFLRKLKAKCKGETDESEKDTDCTLTPDDLQKGENFLIQKAQQSLKARVVKGELKALSPYTDETGIIRVGGRVDKAEMSFEMRHPVLLPYGHWISTLITRHFHESGHNGVAVTTAKARRRFWILKGHNLAKTVKFRCTVCRAFDHKTETQEMADLPTERLSPHTPPFHYTACDYFVLFTCLNSRAVHLELATDCSTMEFLQVLRRFFAIRGQPGKILSDNGTQFIGAQQKLREFCAEKGTEWTFTTPAAPHQNGSAESLVKSCKYALKRAIGEQILTPFELYTCLLEVANLVNQRPIGRIPTEPDDGNYLCPNDMLLGRASSDVAQGPFRETRNPRHRVEFIQRIVDTFWHRWTRDVLPLLAPRQKWHVDRRNVRVDDVAMMADANAVRGKWTIARVIQVYPGPDGKVRNVKVKTPTAEYRRPVTKIAVIYPAEGDDE
ncbi:uncharacterized protein [Diadema setosum]|uniref:uncharacterized protein n=1 Tax=Diadema setosum TaxID=31175 RepID=UPI003B3B1FC1